MPEAAITTEARALLLTDVVDSTQLAERLGDAAMAELNAAHDRVARDLLRRFGGREIDKTDGMLILFEDAGSAVGFAAAYHRALAALPVPLKARAGLHVGTVLLRPNPAHDVAQGAKPLEVEGLAKPLAARVMSLARGGQTLLTREARAALGPGPWQVHSHGHWRIKGVAAPIELFEVGAEGAPFTPPPDSDKVYRVVQQGDLWLPLREIRHDLPAERDAFIGRDEALAALRRRFDEGARLVSLLGIGGTGKTRLAVHYGWTWLGDYPGGVWFCDLTAARDLDGIASAVARGLDLDLRGEDPVAQLGHAIAGRGNCLLILDNFEQVARHAHETLGRWLDRSGQARFLVTTREVLGLPGEEAVALPPMSLPEARALFERRAAAARPDFAASAADRDAVPALVGLLDGMPLAIELAAARVRLMAPQALLSRMDQRLNLLAAQGGRHDRQATLRATFDWSWDLLSTAERAALAQLTVFEGGFSLEAAEAVIDLATLEQPPAALDVLQSLVDKSFVLRHGDSRYGLLVSVQEYAREKLHDAEAGGPDRVAAEQRHASYYGVIRGNDAAVPAEIENCLAALRRVEGRGDPQIAVALLERAWRGLQQRGPFRRAAEAAVRLLRLSPLDDGLRARVHWVAGDALQHGGRGAEAYAHLETAAELAAAGGDAVGRARALRKLGNLDMTRGRAALALERLQIALAVAEAAGRPEIAIDVETSLGNLAEAQGRPETARRHYDTAIAGARAIGDRRREGAALGNLAVLCAESGHMEEALQNHRGALAAADATDNRSLRANTLVNIGMLQQLTGDDAAARESLERALAVARESGNAVAESVARCNLAIVFEGMGRAADAQQHYEAAIELARVIGDRYLEGQFLGYLGRLHARQRRHPEAARCLDAGQSLLEAALDRIGLGILMCSRAEAAHLAGDTGSARQALEMAEATARDVGAGPDSELGMALERLRGPIGAA